MYKTEMHCHSAHVSFCGRAKADLIIEKYLEAGYTTIVSTEHIDHDSFSHMKDASWQDKVSFFVGGCQALTEAAKGRINILLGAELNLVGYNDYLLYGITEEFLRSIDNPLQLRGLEELSPLIRKHNLMLFQAHPFRIGMSISNPDLLDGIEIVNYNTSSIGNDMAQMWAKLNHLSGISGTDFHGPEHTPRGGIMTDYPITDNETLLKTLREKTFTPILR